MQKEEALPREEIEGLLARAGAVDAEEDARHDAHRRGDELPVEFARRARRLAAIHETRERLEAAQRGADEARGRQPGQERKRKGGRAYKRDHGVPDPESRIMKTSTEGFQQCCNAQTVVDEAHQLIVATDVGANASDQGRLVPLLDAMNETFGVEPQGVLADAGYCNEADLVALARRGIDAHVALGREGKAQEVVDPETPPAIHRMSEKRASAKGQAQYARRKGLSEAPNGRVKEVPGFRRFSVRGARKVRGEWHLVCLALNIKRMAALVPCRPDRWGLAVGARRWAYPPATRSIRP